MVCFGPFEAEREAVPLRSVVAVASAGALLNNAAVGLGDTSATGGSAGTVSSELCMPCLEMPTAGAAPLGLLAVESDGTPDGALLGEPAVALLEVAVAIAGV